MNHVPHRQRRRDDRRGTLHCPERQPSTQAHLSSFPTSDHFEKVVAVVQRIPLEDDLSGSGSEGPKIQDRQKYIDSGFDGWILKPIDFKRVDHLLGGVHEDNVRDDSIYTAGMWGKGGWFSKRDKL